MLAIRHLHSRFEKHVSPWRAKSRTDLRQVSTIVPYGAVFSSLRSELCCGISTEWAGMEEHEDPLMASGRLDAE